jgi:P pilus assembly chaperone PapD
MKYILFFALLIPSLVFAQAQVFPTRLTLTEETPSSYLSLKNTTGKPQKYRIELVQFLMKKDGSVLKTDTVNNPLADLLKFSPKTVEIAPNEKQVVRVMATAFDNLADGEYYIYLHFVPESDNKIPDEQPKGKFSLQARIAMAIPVVVRRGTAKVDGKLTALKALPDKNGNIAVSFKLTNTSKYFLAGDLDVIAVTDKGDVPLAKTTGLSSYLPERLVSTVVSKKDLTEKLNNEPIKKVKVRYASNSDSGSAFELSGESELSKVAKDKAPKKPSKRR